MKSFRELAGVNEATEKQLKELTKAFGKPGNGISKTEYIFKFDDGSYIKFDTERDDKRLYYFDKRADLTATYITAKQAITAIGQSNVKSTNEAVLRDRDYKYKDGKVYITKEMFKGVHKDYKGSDKKSMLVLTDKGTSLVPVEFVSDKEVEKLLKESVKKIKFDGKNTKDLEKFSKKNKINIEVKYTGQIIINNKTIFKGDILNADGSITKMYDKANISESKLTEKKFDLETYAPIIAKMTDNNEHYASRLLATKLIDDKRMYEVCQAINSIVEFENNNPISEYTYTFMKKVHDIGRKKYGKDEWNKNIYSNS